jgi:hypothetical protein
MKGGIILTKKNKDITPETTQLVVVEPSNVARDNAGRFLPGKTGNPGGRPKVPEEFKELAKEHSFTALETVVAILQDPDAKAADRLRAADIILDRALGRPVQSTDLDIAGGIDAGIIQVIFSDPNLDEWAK